MKHHLSYKTLVFATLLLLAGGAGAQSLTPLTLGIIAPGDSIVVYYDVTINTPCNCTQIVNQGTVTGSNFTTFNTDDPDTGPAGDATITALNMFPLPVKFFELAALPASGGVKVSWKTGYESGMVGYEVERSADGRQFLKIGSVPAANNANGQTYTFFDAVPLSGLNFYRLKLVEQAPGAAYSPIVKVDRNGSGGISFYPNPVHQDAVTIQLNSLAAGNYDLVFYNSVGQPVFRKSIRHEGGSVTRSVALPTLPKGVYSIRFGNGIALHAQTLIVQ